MRRENKFIYLLTFIFLFVGTTLFAQMSDQQVIQELRRYENSGMSQQQILIELNKKGVTSTQLQRIRAQYQQEMSVTSGGLDSNYDPSGNLLRDPMELPEIEAEVEQINPEDRVYGQNFFSASNLTFAPNINMPTPANYVLGPGDEVIIDMWGDSELNVRYTITPDGHITVSGLGRIQLSGLSVKQAESKIRREFSDIYSDLISAYPNTFLAISVGNVRTIRVNVMGEVVTPGTYTMSSFASAFHALYVSGGPNKIGSIRNIRIFRAGENVATVDLYDYLMSGDNTGDITLQDGDVVLVEPYGALAQIVGEVKRPMWYEMHEGESLQDLIRYAGGYSGNAYRSSITVHRKGETEMEAITLNQPEFVDFRMKDGDQVGVGNILERFSNMVEISGAVERPGQYAIGDRVRTVRDLVEIALGPTGDAYLDRVLLYREQDDLRQTMESFDLTALLSGQISNIDLHKNDRLHIPSVFSLEDSVTVYVGGSVRLPGDYPYAINMRVEDAILRAGGLDEDASTARIDVYRRIKDPGGTSLSPDMSEVYSFTLDEDKIISSDPSFILQPYDRLIVRRSPAYEPQSLVTIEGEVLFGGEYSKKEKNERLSTLVDRAGGLTEYAYAKGARLTRLLTPEEIERSREALLTQARIEGDSTFINNMDLTTQTIGIDLESALRKPGGDDDIILMEGDVLSIPQLNNTVKISGGVMYPNTVSYNKRMGLDSYVRQAGGYSRLAMKSKPFVIYMNGKVATGRWAKIEPGCEIVVPEKPEREPMSMQGILGISTSIASLALLISNLIR